MESHNFIAHTKKTIALFLALTLCLSPIETINTGYAFAVETGSAAKTISSTAQAVNSVSDEAEDQTKSSGTETGDVEKAGENSEEEESSQDQSFSTESDSSKGNESSKESETANESQTSKESESAKENESSKDTESAKESGSSKESETANESQSSKESESTKETETSKESESAKETESSKESESAKETKKTSSVKPNYGIIVSTSTSKYTYTAMVKDIKELAATYPKLVTYTSLGKTYDNRNIYELTVGNPDAKKQILIQASMHAREYMNSLIAMKQVEYLCDHYKKGDYNGKSYKALLDEVCIHVIPMTNPDGVSISQFGASGIRNRTLRAKIKKICSRFGGGRSSYYTYWKANGRGVDLNQNYSLNWHRSSNSSPRSAGYSGTKAESERETKILVKRIKELDPDLVLAYHSTGSIIYWYFHQKGAYYTRCQSLFNLVQGLTGYYDADPGKTSPLGPQFGDWCCSVRHIPTLTIENGLNMCPLKISEWSRLWKKNKNLLPAVMQWVITPSQTSITKRTAGKGTITLKWKKVSCDGYQIQVATKMSMSKAKTYRIKDKKIITKTIEGLKSKKTYYVRVRSYREADGVRFYGKWSAIGKVTVK